MGLLNQRSRNSNQTALNRALEAWRQAEPRGESLSPGTRARILSAAFDTSRGRASLGPLRSLFLPFWRAVAVGAVPALLLAAALVVGSPGWRSGGSAEGAPLRLRAEKQGDDVIFVIANGGRPHVVQRSTAADGRMASDRLSTTGGVFRDSLGSGPDLVYYRID